MTSHPKRRCWRHFALSLALVTCARAGAHAAIEDAEIEGLFTECEFGCDEVVTNCERLILELHARGSLDTVQAVLDYWDRHCPSINSGRLSVMLKLVQGERVEWEPCELLQYARYRPFQRAGILVNHVWSLGLATDPIDSLGTQIARDLLASGSVSGLDSIACIAHAGYVDEFYSTIRSPQYLDTPFRRCYDSVVNEELKRPELYLGGFVGLWFPTGRRSQLGTHPLVGVSAGWVQGVLTCEAAASLGFLKAAHDFSVEQEGNLVSTRDFGLISLALDGERTLVRSPKHRLDFVLGLGTQLLQTAWDESAENPKSIASMQVAVGLAYKLYTGRYIGSFFKVQPRFEMSTMHTGGTDLSGSAFVIRVGYVSSNEHWGLKSLLY